MFTLVSPVLKKKRFIESLINFHFPSFMHVTFSNQFRAPQLHPTTPNSTTRFATARKSGNVHTAATKPLQPRATTVTWYATAGSPTCVPTAAPAPTACPICARTSAHFILSSM